MLLSKTTYSVGFPGMRGCGCCAITNHDIRKIIVAHISCKLEDTSTDSIIIPESKLILMSVVNVEQIMKIN